MAIRISKATSRALLGLGAVTATLSATGAMYQRIATERDRRRHLPPGRFIPVDGVRLHVRELGEGSPTVILEAGLTSMSAQWGWVQPEVAKYTRVVSYDRAGLGFSDCCGQPRDAKTTAKRLHGMLRAAGIPGPYVLVGHSLGGLFARMFAHLYRDEVAGLVLVDAVHPEQRLRWGAASNWKHSIFFGQLLMASYLARIGIPRMSGFRAHMAEGLPEEAALPMRCWSGSCAHLDATALEASAFDRICQQVGEAGGFGDLPVKIISAERWDGTWSERWQALQREMLSLSTNSSMVVVEGSDHISLVTNREHAMVTADVIHQMVQQGRGVSPAPAERIERRSVSARTVNAQSLRSWKNLWSRATQSAPRIPSTTSAR